MNTRKINRRVLIEIILCLVFFTLGYASKYANKAEPVFVTPQRPHVILLSPEGQEIGNLYWVSRIILDSTTGKEDTIELKTIETLGYDPKPDTFHFDPSFDTLHSEIK